MHIFIRPIKDATIYSNNPLKNTGKDEILEIIKISAININQPDVFDPENIYNYNGVSRILIQFDLNRIFNLIESGFINNNPKFYLNLRLANYNSIGEFIKLYIYPINPINDNMDKWAEGTGKMFDNNSVVNGVTWLYRDAELQHIWGKPGGDFVSDIFSSVDVWPDRRSLYYENTSGKNHFYDIRADVTNIVNMWLNSAPSFYKNNGFLIKLSDDDESNNKNYGILRFYSSQTNTIYLPSLEVAWDDSTFYTGELLPADVDDVFIYIKNLKPYYEMSETPKILVSARKQFPVRSFSNISPYSTIYYLPVTSYYSIVDAETGETIIPFDEQSSKISCDENGNYFRLSMSGFIPGRYYLIKIKVVSGQTENIYNIPTQFKVIK